jgi:subtilase family serine protease
VQIVEQAFQTQMRTYQRGSTIHLANSSDISIPQALGGIVRGVNLQNFSFSKPALARATALRHDQATGLWFPINPASSLRSQVAIDPHDFSKIYDLDPVYSSGINGHGQTIASAGGNVSHTLSLTITVTQ